MPYIKSEDKIVYKEGIQSLKDAFAEIGAGDGDLNYVLTSVALAWLSYHQPPYGYALRGDVIKAFECAKFEYYERAMKPYEHQKRLDNGEVYPKEITGV